MSDNIKRPARDEIKRTVGKTINDWTILAIATRTGKSRHRELFVRVRCVCGTESEATWSSVRRGKSKSCGCRRAGSGRRGTKKQRAARIQIHRSKKIQRFKGPQEADRIAGWHAGALGREVTTEQMESTAFAAGYLDGQKTRAIANPVPTWH